MPADESLKRLGGGRWETRDGRFAIEPQSGTWVVVDSTQTDDLGLPLVRGPFGSLTAAKEAIDGIRMSGPIESPLAERLKQARTKTPSTAMNAATSRKPATTKASGAQDVAPPEPPEPPEPKWLRDLQPVARRRARELIERLERLEIPGAEEIARSEIARNQPALVRLAIQRALGRAVGAARSPSGGARAAIGVLLGGRDPDLDVRWRVVDDYGRVVDEVEFTE